MNTNDIFKLFNENTFLRPPYEYDPKKTTYYNDLELRLKKFVESFDNLPKQGVGEKLKKYKKDVQIINSIILTSLKNYSIGNYKAAYNGIDRIFKLQLIRENIDLLSSKITHFSKDANSPKFSLYRVRVSDVPITTHSEMFHIPLNKRHLVGHQRYSMAGLPCLYLGTSIYICWKEMGEPNLNSVYISEFNIANKEIAKKIKVLNLAYNLESLYDKNYNYLFDNDINEDLAIAYLLFFPILLSCSYVRAYKKATFHVEYIIPNMIFQWLCSKESEFEGICYLSTVSKHTKLSQITRNYVFPAFSKKTYAASRYKVLDKSPELKEFSTTLAENFSFSNPISWQLLSTLPFEKNSRNEFRCTNGDIDTCIIENYECTEFSIAEKKIKKYSTIKQLNA